MLEGSDGASEDKTRFIFGRGGELPGGSNKDANGLFACAVVVSRFLKKLSFAVLFLGVGGGISFAGGVKMAESDGVAGFLRPLLLGPLLPEGKASSLGANEGPNGGLGGTNRDPNEEFSVDWLAAKVSLTFDELGVGSGGVNSDNAGLEVALLDDDSKVGGWNMERN